MSSPTERSDVTVVDRQVAAWSRIIRRYRGWGQFSNLLKTNFRWIFVIRRFCARKRMVIISLAISTGISGISRYCSVCGILHKMFSRQQCMEGIIEITICTFSGRCTGNQCIACASFISFSWSMESKMMTNGRSFVSIYQSKDWKNWTRNW